MERFKIDTRHVYFPLALDKSSRGMGNTAALRRDFGDRLVFWGGGIDVHTLCLGTPDEVSAEVRHRIRDLAPDGGYIFAPVHCIQPIVPPENIIAIEAVDEFGVYPIV